MSSSSTRYSTLHRRIAYATHLRGNASTKGSEVAPQPDRGHDPFRAFEVLHRHGIRFVAIGGVAAILHGYPLTTGDTDVTPARDPENYEKLVGALSELNAR